MAVRGLDRFISDLSQHRDSFVLIGGTACDIWFTKQNLTFRATKDLDVVLILDHVSQEFITKFWEVITNGEYQIKNRSEGGAPILYRFEKPINRDYPHSIELFCRRDAGLEDLAPTQQLVHIKMEDARSLSAILLHDSCYEFLVDNCRESKGILVADATALIPLKARAWIDLTERKTKGEPVDEKDIKKHRADVFRLAVLLPEDQTVELPQELEQDIVSFLEKHPATNPEWRSIQDSIRPTIGGPIRPETLIAAIQRYFKLVP